MRFAIMIEGQQGVTWDDWLSLARDCERLGFETVFRSDHYSNDFGAPFLGSLDAWGTICALAAVTDRLRLGTLVSPVTFRHPSNLAKLVVTADHVSGGRIELGIGTGWMELEHRAYGFPFPPLRERMDRLAEQLEVIAGSFGPGPFSFAGEYYAVEGLDAQPKPVQQPFPIVMGGAAAPRGAALAARFAAEYNVVFATPEDARAARERLVRACEDRGRDPGTLHFSLMHGLLLGRDEAELERRAAQLPPGARKTFVAGTPEQVVARLREYEAAGVERVMLQHLLVRDRDVLELLAAEVVPAFA